MTWSQCVMLTSGDQCFRFLIILGGPHLKLCSFHPIMPGRRNVPARLDPNILQIGEICRTEDAAILYAKEKRLLPQHNGNRFPCAMTPNCNGEVYETTCADNRRNRATVRPIYRCNVCKKKRSQRGGDQVIGGQGAQTWFASIDQSGRPNSKLSISVILLLVWCWAKGMTIKMTKEVLCPLIGNCNRVCVDWFNYMREILLNRLQDAPAMGGPGQIVQIDESYFSGRRKYNRGRILQGNRAPPARQNYGRQILGPWVFGMVWKHPDGTVEKRFFHVLRRNRATLRPIIERHIAGGTTIISDEWRAYTGLATWNPVHGNQPYVHRTVNHSENFVDPITGTNTQRIETCWGDLKTKLIRCMRGMPANLLRNHLAEAWWRSIHRDTPFLDLVDEIGVEYPLG
jgi:hypothetical protein